MRWRGRERRRATRGPEASVSRRGSFAASSPARERTARPDEARAHAEPREETFTSRSFAALRTTRSPARERTARPDGARAHAEPRTDAWPDGARAHAEPRTDA